MTTLIGWVLVIITSTSEPMLQMQETSAHLYKRHEICQQNARIASDLGVKAYCMEVRANPKK